MNSRSIKFRYDLLSKYEMKIGEISSVKGSVSLNSLAEIKRTGRFTISEVDAKDIDFLNDRLRPVVIIDDKEYRLGTFLLPSPTRKTQKGIITRDIEAYDVLQILKEDRITNRLFYKKGSRYEDIIRQMVNSAGIKNVLLEKTDSVLKRDREFEIGTSKLDVCNQLLQETNYTTLFTDENGVVKAKKYILPNARAIEISYLANEFDITVRDSAVDEYDLFNIPNVWVIIVSNGENEPMRAIYRNDNPADRTSTVARGRNIVDFREVSDIADQTTLNNYIKRVAYDSSNIFRKIQFETLINPVHGYGNCIYIEDKKLGIREKYIETMWEIPLEVGGRMKHAGRRIVLNV